ncbi:cytochrome c biogenesis CcdA family protein [Pontibacterium sp.]|uniref:cytochrome c biogenesis CcdA family protein n=1 Tax=Pontibacterium sp. TaxID=2036026 RepID=UPI003562C2F6
MDTATWMQMGGIGGLSAALLAGFLFSFTPVAFASIPVALAYVTRAREFKEAVNYGSAFAAGLIFTHVVLGVGAALGGAWAQDLLSRQWGVVLGPLLIMLGFLWTGWLPLPMPWLPWRGRRAATLWGAFMLGMPFTVGVCPVCSPGLWIGLGVSASIGSVIYGGLLMLAFAIGRVIPLLVGAISIGWLESLLMVGRWRRTFETLGGLTLIMVGLYLLNEYYLWI